MAQEPDKLPPYDYDEPWRWYTSVIKKDGIIEKKEITFSWHEIEKLKQLVSEK